MNTISVHYNTKNNIGKFFLAQHVEWRFVENYLVLYNTLFDTVVIAKPINNKAAHIFVESLEKGCTDVLSVINLTFDQSPKAVYSLLINKKIIE